MLLVSELRLHLLQFVETSRTYVNTLTMLEHYQVIDPHQCASPTCACRTMAMLDAHWQTGAVNAAANHMQTGIKSTAEKASVLCIHRSRRSCWWWRVTTRWWPRA